MATSSSSSDNVVKPMQLKKYSLAHYLWRDRWLYALLLPGLIYFIVYKYGPMFGLIMAFQDYKPIPSRGFLRSDFVGLRHFIRFFNDPAFPMLLKNTLLIALYNMVFYFPLCIIVALLLNEVRHQTYKKFVQTITYIPHFLSFVVIASLTYKLLSAEVGVVNGILNMMGKPDIHFLTSAQYIKTIIVSQGIWRDVGWGSIIFLAALTNISPDMYEAAKVEGANRLQMLWYVTLPLIRSTIVIVLILRLGRFLDLGFEQIFIQLNAGNRAAGEIFDTYIYTMGVINGQFSYNAAIGLFKSVVGAFLVIGSNSLARKMGEEGVF